VKDKTYQCVYCLLDIVGTSTGNCTMKGHRSIKQSKQLRRKASKYIPVDLANSIFIDEASGSRIWDVDGNEYIDYKLGWGPVILGHSHPAVQNRVHEYDKKGICYALDNQLEVSVAQKIRSLVPSAKMIRYFVSGTEATMHAIRIARAYTKKKRS
jgi:glutamate-1-semialdehyde aminotransferase